jgi:hypothetical protein
VPWLASKAAAERQAVVDRTLQLMESGVLAPVTGAS